VITGPGLRKPKLHPWLHEAPVSVIPSYNATLKRWEESYMHISSYDNTSCMTHDWVTSLDRRDEVCANFVTDPSRSAQCKDVLVCKVFSPHSSSAVLTFCAFCILTASVILSGHTSSYRRALNTQQPWWPTFPTLGVLVYRSFANCMYHPVQNCRVVTNVDTVIGCFNIQLQYYSGQAEKKTRKVCEELVLCSRLN
jgi:hypothetical protein